MARDCQLERWKQCCCTCKWQYVDRSHPGTDGKPMSSTRGYICAEPFLGYHSGWTEHGMCECWTERPPEPNVLDADVGDNAWYELEAWDACYRKRDSMPTWWRLQKK